MPQTSPLATLPDPRPATAIDPLTAYIRRQAPHPVPLVSTHHDIAIEGGLVRVEATRLFRNAESTSIEATLTFPVPVGAVLYRLEAVIGGRKLTALAQSRTQARETYEAALDAGKTAVLHEELLPGIHMLSVGHIAPGTEIGVTIAWSMLPSFALGKAQLRIPVTAGDVYGHSGLADSDELVHGGPAAGGTVSITYNAQAVRLNGKPLLSPAESLPVPMDAPVDIEIEGAAWGIHEGRFADGRSVSMRIEPAPERDTAIRAALLLDRSGSMAEPVSGGGPKATKHSAALLGLSEAGVLLREGDTLALWEFDNAATVIGTARTAREMQDLLANLSPPGGGTEIGAALAKAAASGVHDVVVVTDGKSHALDVQALARTGCRFSVVLVGEDSLEANMGRLAALTGGALFVAFGADIATAIAGAVASSRLASAEACTASEGSLFRRGGLSIGIAMGKEPLAAARNDGQRAVAALAAGLLMSRLDGAEALKLSLAEGLVSHLTSLVLVDAGGPTAGQIAEQRKIALPSPRTVGAAQAASMAVPRGSQFALRSHTGPHGAAPATDSQARSAAPSPVVSAPLPRSPASAPAKEAKRQPTPDLFVLAGRIAWNQRPQGLIDGDLTVLARDIAEAIRAAAAEPWLMEEARRLGLTPAALILGLMAQSQAGRDRMAARVARGILKAAESARLSSVAQRLGLPAAGSRS